MLPQGHPNGAAARPSYPGMDAKHTATCIKSSLLAALRIALEQGALTADNLDAIAHAAANNAAQQLLVAEQGAAER